MRTTIAFAVCLAFIAIALWHVHMARATTIGVSGAVPTVDGKPLFTPSRKATLAVAVVLLLFAALVASTAGLIATGLPPVLLRWLSYALAAGLLARAIGDFRYLGFFKRVRGSRFATLDSWVYSPICLLLAIGVALVA
jgi:hypothetical protein